MDSPEILTVGRKLRAAREDKGATIADVAAEIMVPQHYLTAIEEDQYAKLPGQTYAIGFVRNYSRFLDLPAAEIVEQLKSEVDFPKTLDTVEIASGFVDPPKQNVLPSGASVAAGLCVAVGVYGLWFAASATQPLSALPAALPDVVLAPSAEEKNIIKTQIASMAPAMAKEVAPAAVASAAVAPTAVARVAPAVERHSARSQYPAAAVSAPAKLQPTSAKQNAASAVKASVVEEQSARDEAERELSKTQVAAAKAQQAKADPAAKPNRAADDAGALEMVTIHVEEEAWFEIRTAGKIYFSGIKQAGDVVRVPGDRAANSKLTTGNAGGIWLSVGNWSSQTLGKPGRVRRNLALAPSELLSVLKAADPS